MKVYAALNAARAEFHTLKLKKTGKNAFAGYSYFELGDFLIPALETFSKHGLCAYISFGENLATMRIVALEDGSHIELTSPMADAQLKGCHPIQNLGAVETYTRRYLWVAALEIVEHDAVDSAAPVETTRKKPANYDPRAHIPATKGIDETLTERERQDIQVIAYDAERLFKADGVEAAKEFLQDQGLEGDALEYLKSLRSQELKKALKQLTQPA